MNKKLLIVVGIGLLGALASTYLFYHLMSNNLSAKVEATNTEHAVVVAARELPRGTALTLDDVTVTLWSAPAPPPGSFQDPKQLIGKTLKNEVLYSEPVLSSSLVVDQESWLASRIPQGMRGVTVHVSEFAGVTEHLQVGDRVDVLVADGPLSPGNRDLRLRTILQNVEVLTTGRETEGPQNRAAAVTILVAAKDSEKLNLADQSGSIRLALRNPLDASTETTTGGKLSDLIAGRDTAPAAAPRAKAAGVGVPETTTRPARAGAHADPTPESPGGNSALAAARSAQ